MNKKTKSRKVPGYMRDIFADNLKRLIAKRYKSLPNITRRLKELETDSGVRYSTIQRCLSCETGPNLDTIEQIGGVFELSAYQMLIPKLNIDEPQEIKGADKAGIRMHHEFVRKLRKKSTTPEDESAPVAG